MSDLSDGFISTGHLPPPELTTRLVQDAYEIYHDLKDGRVSDVYPALEAVDPDLFGICLVGTSGRVIALGDAEVVFPIMSVAKPFVFALVCQTLGAERLRELIGVNSTGYPFNSLAAIERSQDGRTNPMVNAGAIATTSLAPGDSIEERWQFIRTGLSEFAGKELRMMDEILESALATNFRNRAIGATLEDMGRLYCDTGEALELYTRECSLGVSARDLAVMGATLADGGVNPVTGKWVVDPITCHYTMAVMATAGMYETSGDWLYETGLPGKSGIGGGIVTVAPGKGSLGTYAPRLDAAGNSVQGQRVAAFLSGQLGMDLFLSRPARK